MLLPHFLPLLLSFVKPSNSPCALAEHYMGIEGYALLPPLKQGLFFGTMVGFILPSEGFFPGTNTWEIAFFLSPQKTSGFFCPFPFPGCNNVECWRPTCMDAWRRSGERRFGARNFQLGESSCCWFRNLARKPLGMLKKPINNGRNYQPQLVS